MAVADFFLFRTPRPPSLAIASGSLVGATLDG
jgi:hypothetical protein